MDNIVWECDDMRERILEILREKMPEPVSGEILSQELAVSYSGMEAHPGFKKRRLYHRVGA